MMHKKVYKCRLCGQKFDNGIISGDIADMRSEVWQEIMSKPLQFAAHECYGGDIGIGDFQGYEVVNE